MRLWLRNFPARHFLARYFATNPVQVPWYVEPSTTEKDLRKPPTLPEKSPKSLSLVVEFAHKNLGLADLEILDARERPNALGPALMVLGTGKSERHLRKASQELLLYLKKEFGVVARQEGLLSANHLRRFARRARKKAERARYYTVEDVAPQKTGSWIAVDTCIEDIHVHMMDAAKREEIDLGSAFGQEFSCESEAQGEYVSPVTGEPERLERVDVHGPKGRRSFSTMPKGSVLNAIMPKVTRSFSTLTSGHIIEGALNSPPGTRTFTAHHQSENVFAPKLVAGRFMGIENVRKQSTKQTKQGTQSTQSASAQIEKVLLSKNTNLTRTSPEVVSFYESLPSPLSASDYNARLLFICACCLSAPANFQLSEVVREAATKQAAGFPLAPDEVEAALTTIALGGDPQKAFPALVDEKAALVLALFDVSFRASGHSLLCEPFYLRTIFKMLCRPQPNSILPQTALENPVSRKGSILYDQRADPLVQIIRQTGQLVEYETLLMIAACYLNQGRWNDFWQLLNSVILLATVTQRVLETLVAMVVSTGNKAEITKAVTVFVPDLITKGHLTLTKELSRLLGRALEVIDAEKESFGPLRLTLSRIDSEEQV